MKSYHTSQCLPQPPLPQIKGAPQCTLVTEYMVPPTPLLSARSPVRALGGGKSVNPATGASSESSVPLPPSGTTLSSPQCTASRLSCGSSSSVSCSPSCCLGFRVRVGEGGGGGANGLAGGGTQQARWKSKPAIHSRAFHSKEASSSFPY